MLNPITLIRIKYILTSYDTICATALTEPRKAYLLLLDQPLKAMVNILNPIKTNSISRLYGWFIRLFDCSELIFSPFIKKNQGIKPNDRANIGQAKNRPKLA